MRPESSRRPNGRVEQVKLLRSEYAAVKSIQSQFSRTLFVANLPQARQAALPSTYLQTLHIRTSGNLSIQLSNIFDWITIM